MNIESSLNLLLAIAAIQLAVLSGLLWMSWANRRNADDQDLATRLSFDLGISQIREALAAYKLTVSKHYLSKADFDAMEGRLRDLLMSIAPSSGRDGTAADEQDATSVANSVTGVMPPVPKTKDELLAAALVHANEVSKALNEIAGQCDDADENGAHFQAIEAISMTALQRFGRLSAAHLLIAADLLGVTPPELVAEANAVYVEG